MDNLRPAPTLDELGILTGTDKSLFGSDYLRHYDAVFSPLKHSDVTVLEIGVFHGSSMTLWAQYFTKAHIIGIDINPACERFATDRVTIEIGDLEDPEFMLGLATRYTPTIIVDDGSHRADHQISAFERLFPALKPGGFYAVEDLNLQLTEPDATRLRGDALTSSVEYFQKIIERRLASRHQRRHFRGLPAYFARTIDSIQVVQQALIMRKAAEAAPFDEELTKIRPFVEESGHYYNWLRLGVLLQEKGRIPEAMDAFRHSIAAKPDEVAASQYLSGLLEKQGDLPGAIKVLEPLPALVRSHASLAKSIEDRLADLRRRV